MLAWFNADKGARLGPETSDGLFVLSQLFGQKRQRHGSSQPRVPGAVDDTRPARAKLAIR